jgi:hypothetical protein
MFNTGAVSTKLFVLFTGNAPAPPIVGELIDLIVEDSIYFSLKIIK